MLTERTRVEAAIAMLCTPTMTDSWLTHTIEPDGHAVGDEWLLTNGTGAYAMGTVGGLNTRRYHGLLIATTRPPVGRVVALNQVLERLTFPAPGRGRPARPAMSFTTCAFRGADGGTVLEPNGSALLTRFEHGLCTRWTYASEDVLLVRELFLHWRQQAVTLRYALSGPCAGATLNLHPMVTLRDFHQLAGREDEPEVEAGTTQVMLRSGVGSVTIACDSGRFVADPDWWYRVHYPVESERGQDDREDQFLPGYFEVPLAPGDDVHEIMLTAALGGRLVGPCASSAARAGHLAPMVERIPADRPTAMVLARAADDFVAVRRIADRELSTILAGFPWFADWGRDTFIALPGLLLTTGRFQEARATLETFAAAIADGLVPNVFDDYDDTAAHYNTVDASLWFIHAALEYVETTGDRAAWEGWMDDAIAQILNAYIRGTAFGIGMAGDGLISAGTPQSQLTWMDAARDGVVFTPRCGKAVEINALWHHALMGTARLVGDVDARRADHYTRLAARTRRAFLRVFWDPERSVLRDCVWTDAAGEEHIDASLRPNQVFAVSVPHSPLPRTRQHHVLESLRNHLLTPFGLRTLPAEDANYHGSYRGSPFERDQAYHQGTVWPWLIGPYAEGLLRAGQFSPAAIDQARSAIEPLLQFMLGPGLGQLREIHEADPPHRPVGCIAQAWSVAQVLRVLDLIRRAS